MKKYSSKKYAYINFWANIEGAEFDKSIFIKYSEIPKLVEIIYQFMRANGIECEIGDQKQYDESFEFDKLDKSD